MGCTPTCITNNTPNKSKLPKLMLNHKKEVLNPVRREPRVCLSPSTGPGMLRGWHVKRDTTKTRFNHAPVQNSHSPCCEFTLGHTAHETHTKRFKLSLCFPSGFWC